MNGKTVRDREDAGNLVIAYVMLASRNLLARMQRVPRGQRFTTNVPHSLGANRDDGCGIEVHARRTNS